MLEDLNIHPDYDGFVYLAESVRNPPVLKPHRHVELELNLVARGEITYIVGDRRTTFGPRTLLWMFPSQTHQLVDRSADARYYVAVFKPGLIRDACRGDAYQALHQSPAPSHPVLHRKLDPKTFDLISRSIDELMTDGPDADTLNREAGFGAASNFNYRHTDPDWLNAGLRHLLLLSWRHQRGHRGDHREVSLHPGVRQAIQLLAAPEAPENLDELAHQCGISSAYLSRIFRRQVGVPLTRYRNSLRLTRFWDVYRLPHHRTILEAAYAAGFGSYAQFHRVYTEAYGCGPRESLSDLSPAPDSANSAVV